jgi:hypothetical protein
VECGSCGATNPAGSKICNQCGGQLGDSSNADFAAQFPHPGPLDGGGPGGSLPQRFQRMGTLAGRRRSEIEKVVGPPNSISAVARGCVLLQWMKTSAWTGGFHIALILTRTGCVAV